MERKVERTRKFSKLQIKTPAKGDVPLVLLRFQAKPSFLHS